MTLPVRRTDPHTSYEAALQIDSLSRAVRAVLFLATVENGSQDDLMMSPFAKGRCPWHGFSDAVKNEWAKVVGTKRGYLPGSKEQQVYRITAGGYRELMRRGLLQ